MNKPTADQTAALLIRLAVERLQNAPLLRKQMNITLTDLRAAEKVARRLNKLNP